ncbi:MAG TPA: NTF2-like N-terminal transpeptidase domain-containing protein [Mycobacteriales bacterium]
MANSPEAPTTGPDRTLPTATAFLRAWAGGDLDQAAALTDAPMAARARLGELYRNLPITDATLVPHAADAGNVAFTATLNLRGVGAWKYDSAVPVHLDGETWRVSWSPAIINPKLTEDLVLRLGPTRSAPTRSGVADRHGTVLTAAEHPSLSGILASLAARHPAQPGVVSAKTGTAEVAGQPANGWMIAFRGDLTVGCVVQGGDAGEGSAGPVVRALLQAVR